MFNRKIDLENKTFGRLSILDMAFVKNYKCHWNAECVCGKRVIVRRDHIVSGRVRSCGCYNSDKSKKDLNGMVFGRLTIIRENGRSKHKGLVWFCKCRCGEYVNVRASKLLSGNTSSCGCLHKEISSIVGKIVNTTHGQSYTKAYRSAFDAKRRMWKNNGNGYSEKQVSALFGYQNERCAWCQKRINYNKSHIDHIVPLSKNGNHDITNIQILCPKCNLSKSYKDPIIWAQEQGRLL